METQGSWFVVFVISAMAIVISTGVIGGVAIVRATMRKEASRRSAAEAHKIRVAVFQPPET